MRKLLQVLVWMLWVMPASAQLVSFTATPSGKDIQILWTVDAGYVIDDLRIEYSTDSVYFSAIYTYPGPCGNFGYATSYSYTHASPAANRSLYYRINMGVYGYSAVVSVSTRGRMSYTAAPMPFDEYTTIKFDNSQYSSCDLYLAESTGQVARIETGIRSGEYILYRNGLRNGLYYFVITDYQRIFISGRIYVSN